MIICSVGYKSIREQKNKNIKFVMSMGAGWNLGNSLESYGRGKNSGTLDKYEMYWENPKTTKDMISAIKEQGFRTIRIPVTWFEHVDENGVIDSEWLGRVQEVVDYCMENDLYAIINVHHDPWMLPTKENESYATKMIQGIWTQVAHHFSKYDNHLIFENLNEARLVDSEYEWTSGTKEARQIVNHFNEVFVSTVRSVPGNKNRYLMVAPYVDKASKEVLNEFKLPRDEKLIVTIHEYTPYSFAMNKEGAVTWSESNENDTKPIREAITNCYEYFIKKGIPVIFGEFGAVDKNNLQERISYTKYFVSLARSKHMMCIWWDEGGSGDSYGRFQLFDRFHKKFIYPEIAHLLTKLQSEN